MSGALLAAASRTQDQDRESLRDALALAAVARHGASQPCHRECPGTPRCPHLRRAWRWITG